MKDTSLEQNGPAKKFLRGPLGLAPMLTATNFASRLWFSQTSIFDFAIAPFLRVTRSDDIKKIPILYVPEINEVKGGVNYPLIPQLMVNNSDDFLRFADHFLRFCEHVDLNCGCPAPTSVFRGGGSSLIETPEKFQRFVETIVKKLGPQKISIKMRIGFKSEGEFPDLLKIISPFPLAHVTIHGRTAKENYLGKARWNLVERAGQILTYPVIGSGDVFSNESFALKKHEAPSINYFMVGRGILRNPWIMRELRSSECEKISLRVLIYALSCFGALQMMQLEDAGLLLKAVRKGFFLGSCGSDEREWEKLYFKLVSLARGKPLVVEEFDPGPAAFSLVKMIWHKISSSLPEMFWTRKPLHAKSFTEFIETLKKVDRSAPEHERGMYMLSHRPELDAAMANQVDKNSMKL